MVAEYNEEVPRRILRDPIQDRPELEPRYPRPPCKEDGERERQDI